MEKSKYDIKKIEKILSVKVDKVEKLMNKCNNELEDKPEDDYFQNKASILQKMMNDILMTFSFIKKGIDTNKIILYMNKNKVKLSDKDIPEVKFSKPVVKSKYDVQKIKKTLTDKHKKLILLFNKCNDEIDNDPDNKYYYTKSELLATIINNISDVVNMIDDDEDTDEIILYMNKHKVKLSDKDIPEINFSKPIAKKGKITIIEKQKEEDDEDIPELTLQQKKDLVKKIPPRTYKLDERNKIIQLVYSNHIKEVKDFPKPPPKAPVGRRGGFRENSGRKKEIIDEEAKLKVEEAKKISKEAMKVQKLKEKELRKIKSYKPYYMSGVVPEGFRPATLAEAMKANKIGLWGVKKADSKAISGLPKKDIGKQIMIDIAGLTGKIMRLRNNIKASKSESEILLFQEELNNVIKE